MIINKNYIAKIIRTVWEKDIQKDYNKSYFLLEDSLKNSFYFHLRRRIKDALLEDNCIRIYPEYYLRKNKKRVDIALVKVNEYDIERGNKHLRDCVRQVLAIIEFKYKSKTVKDSLILEDIDKLEKYYRNNKESILFFAFVHEFEIEGKTIRKAKKMAKHVKLLTARFFKNKSAKFIAL
ncbi:MAG: hypothetical protein HY920_08105 [Elusimicrobia bacterium]|nr:hypothetical protein [Elusimicrobiota bacterium]